MSIIQGEPLGHATNQDVKNQRLGLGSDTTAEASASWFARAKKVLAGGISSSARATTTGTWPYPLYMTHGKGSRIWDADGHEFIDFLNSYGSVVLGHADPLLAARLGEQMTQGTMFGTCNMAEVKLAELLCQMVPCAQLVRYANSGSEAICGAIRAARGYTGRTKLLKFEGHYHGWVDVLAISNRPAAADFGPLEAPHSHPHSKGLPRGVVDDVVICPWNQPEILRAILDRHDGQFAAVIAEPVVANNGCIMPVKGFLQTLRQECTRRGIVLIFDEIVTGFRMAPGGAQEVFGVVPDLAVFSKALGGGLPISAFAGKREVMEPIGANTVKHGGTYNGNPLCATAALETLQRIQEPGTTRRMNQLGQQVMETLRRCARDRGIPCIVQGVGSMFQIVFTSQTPRHYRDLMSVDTARFARLHQALLRQGIHINSSGLACWFISAAHTAQDVELTGQAIERAFAEI